MSVRLKPVAPPSADPEGGIGGPDPPWKITSWVSIGNKLLDPTLEKVGPPWRELDSLWNLEK